MPPEPFRDGQFAHPAARFQVWTKVWTSEPQKRESPEIRGLQFAIWRRR